MACEAVLVGARGTSSGSSVSTTAGTTAASGSSFALFVSWDGGQTISGTITDSKSNTYTAVGSPQGDWTSTWGQHQWFYCEDGVGGTSHSVTVNFSGSAFPTIHLLEITSDNGAPIYDSAAYATTRDGASPYTVTSGTLTEATSVVLAGCGANRGADGAYSSSNFTILSQEPAVSSFWTSGVAKLVVAATTAQTPSFTVLNRNEDAAVIAISFYEPTGGDTTAPTLTSPTSASTGTTTGQGTVTTDEGNGTMYAVVSTSATPPSVAQIQAGNDSSGSAAAWSGNQAIGSTGVKTFNSTGLTASTAYYYHFQHTDAAANDSTVSTSAQFTTDSPPAGYRTAWLRA